MKKLIMGIGLPGSGKTTVLKEFARQHGYSYICPDDIRFEITGDSGDQSKNREVWEEAYRRTAQELKLNNSVVFDATFINPEQRKDFIKFGRENDAEKVQGVFLDIPSELARERNSSRERIVPEYAMDRMSKNLQDFPPELEDGFDGLFYLDEEGELKEAEIISENRVIHREFGKLL